MLVPQEHLALGQMERLGSMEYSAKGLEVMFAEIVKMVEDTEENYRLENKLKKSRVECRSER